MAAISMKEFKPIGLRIVNGQMLTPFKTCAAYYRRTHSRRRTVCKSSMRVSFRSVRKLRPPIQCGPFLVDRSQRVGG